MCGGGKSSGSVSSANRGRAPAPKEKAKQSGEDSDDSVHRTKNRRDQPREISCAKAAREEVGSLLSEPAPKKKLPETETARENDPCLATLRLRRET
jgi:hypothetical protein